MDDSKIDYITQKLDHVSDKVNETNTMLQVHVAKFDSAVQDNERDRQNIARNTEILNHNTESLKEHMAQTQLLRDYVKKIDDRFTPIELEALKRKAVGEWWKNRVVFLAKLGGALGALGALGAIAKFLIHYLW